MKITCDQSVLSVHLSMVSRAIPARSSHPILSNVKLSSREGGLELTGFDLNIGVTTLCPAELSEDLDNVTLALPAKLLNEIVAKLPSGNVSIEIEEINVTIISAGGKYKISGLSAADYPELPKLDGEPISIPTEPLMQGLRAVLFATSTDESKQVLQGVRVVGADGLEFAATDGHRLAVSSPALDASDDAPAVSHPDLALTIPAKALVELQRMIAMLGVSEIQMWFDGVEAVFRVGTWQLTSRLLEGQYPKYSQLIPNHFERSATVSRTALIASLERISIIADEKNGIVQMDFSANAVQLSARTADVGSGTEELPAQLLGEGLQIAFKAKYLIDGLKAMNSAEVQIQMNGPTSPAVLTPVGGQKLRYLVMPVRIRV